MLTKIKQIERQDRFNNFLNEYKELCLKYQIEVFGCGCCDSPFCIELKKRNIELDIKSLKGKGLC